MDQDVWMKEVSLYLSFSAVEWHLLDAVVDQKEFLEKSDKNGVVAGNKKISLH